MKNEKRNVLLLAACLAFGMSTTSLIMTAAAVAGTLIAPDPGLATLPLALMFVGMMLTPLPASLLMKRMGRRFGFVTGSVFGMVGGAVATLATWRGDFVLFSAGLVLLGVAAAFNQLYRFAAADVASPAFRPRAISWVMAGGIVAAFLGPNLATWTKDLFTTAEFAGTFATLPLLHAGTLLLIGFVELPAPSSAETSGPTRPLREIARQPAFVAAVLAGIIGFAGMNFVMTSTPLAVLDHAHHTFSDAAFVLQWHVVGMYAPAFFTGRLIGRFGSPAVMMTGALLYVGCVALNLSGGTLMLSFWPALILLGIGWNFLFVGATTLLTETYRAAEKAKVQGMNDFLVFTAVAVSALSSGTVHALAGWATVNLVLLALTGVVACVLLWLMGVRRTAAQAQPG
ncbi:MFS transporter [Arenibaculum sp.]|uniref:MFS transporter n=1 Tax=Arenibaculum sp. TaxID=2865862 RepID=UPI002E15258A|nr:MFS transporter [Arenibaculum sp.]